MIGFVTSGAGRLVLAALTAAALLAGAFHLGQRNAENTVEIKRIEQRERTLKILEGLNIGTRNLSDSDLIDRLSR